MAVPEAASLPVAYRKGARGINVLRPRVLPSSMAKRRFGPQIYNRWFAGAR